MVYKKLLQAFKFPKSEIMVKKMIKLNILDLIKICEPLVIVNFVENKILIMMILIFVIMLFSTKYKKNLLYKFRKNQILYLFQ